MWSMQEMFYGASEPVWIVKPEKADNKKADSKSDSGGKAKEADNSFISSVPYYIYYNPEYTPAPAEKKESKAADKKETKVVVKVPICCGECVGSIEIALHGMKGVKSVDCNIRREKVTVIATTASPADILMDCRKLFRKSRMWSDDD